MAPPPRPRHPPRSSATVLARVVETTLCVGVAEGWDRAALLEAAGLRDLDLENPDLRIPLSAQVALLHFLAKGSPEPGFGVRAGAALEVRGTGLLGYLLHYSGTLGDALHRLARYNHVLTEAFSVSVELSEPQYALLVLHHHEAGTDLPFAIDYRLAAIVGMCRQITGVNVVPARVEFGCVQPQSSLQHRRFFQCELRFQQAASQIVLHRRDLDLRVLGMMRDEERELIPFVDRVLHAGDILLLEGPRDEILRIEDAFQPPMPPQPMVSFARDAADMQVETPVAPGEIEIPALVTLTVAIQ